jgi:hypothetical protein
MASPEGPRIPRAILAPIMERVALEPKRCFHESFTGNIELFAPSRASDKSALWQANLSAEDQWAVCDFISSVAQFMSPIHPQGVPQWTVTNPVLIWLYDHRAWLEVALLAMTGAPRFLLPEHAFAICAGVLSSCNEHRVFDRLAKSRLEWELLFKHQYSFWETCTINRKP